MAFPTRAGNEKAADAAFLDMAVLTLQVSKARLGTWEKLGPSCTL